QQMVFKKNPNYWKKGLPHVDELIVRVIPDEANIVAALRTGQVHHAFIEDNKNYTLLKDEKSLTGYRSSRLGYDYLNMSANRGPLGDVRVRQAISWAVDRAQVMRVATAGFGRLTAPCTAPMKQWQLPEEQWMKYYKPDLEKAKKLMAEAGVPNGFSVKCSVIPTFPTMVSGAPVIAGPAQAHRHQHGDRERRVRGVDQALARPRLRHDHERDARVRRSRRGVLPPAALDQGAELELVERAGGRRAPGRGPAHDGPEEAQGGLRPPADHDPRERAAPLALLGRSDRLHAGRRQGLPPASDGVAVRPGGRRDREGLDGAVARYGVVRLYSMAVTLIGLSVLVFLMLRLVPGTVVEQLIGADAVASPAMVAELKRFFGLDQPWWRQYGLWIAALGHGDLGTSWRTGKPVVALILERLPVTVQLTGLAVAGRRHRRRQRFGDAPRPGGRQRHARRHARGAVGAGVLAGHDADPVLLDLPALDAASRLGRLLHRSGAQPDDHGPAGPVSGHRQRGQHRAHDAALHARRAALRVHPHRRGQGAGRAAGRSQARAQERADSNRDGGRPADGDPARRHRRRGGGLHLARHRPARALVDLPARLSADAVDDPLHRGDVHDHQPGRRHAVRLSRSAHPV